MRVAEEEADQRWADKAWLWELPDLGVVFCPFLSFPHIAKRQSLKWCYIYGLLCQPSGQHEGRVCTALSGIRGSKGYVVGTFLHISAMSHHFQEAKYLLRELWCKLCFPNILFLMQPWTPNLGTRFMNSWSTAKGWGEGSKLPVSLAWFMGNVILLWKISI